MHLIAHRGNLTGPDPENENHPGYILAALHAGFEVEVDVWSIEGEWYLGHDYPQHRVEEIFFDDHRMWLHAKNFEALKRLSELGKHVFWHEEDQVTLTSFGYLWTYPGGALTSKSICVMPERNNVIPVGSGVCSDYIGQIQWNEAVKCKTFRKMCDETEWGDSVNHFLDGEGNRKWQILGMPGGSIAGLSLAIRNVVFSGDPLDEAAMDGEGRVFSFRMGKSDHIVGDIPVRIQDGKRNKQGYYFYLNNKPLANYYHCFVDALGILASYFEMKKWRRNIKLLMHRTGARSKNQFSFANEMLLKLGFSHRNVEYIQRETIYENVLTGSYLGLDKNGVRTIPTWHLGEMYSVIKGECKSSMSIGDRIYISRRVREGREEDKSVGENNLKNRELINEGELVKLLVDQYGFKEMFAEDYTLEEKVSIFGKANHVAGVWGAGFINTVFCPPGAKIISFGSPNFKLKKHKKANVYCGDVFKDKQHITINLAGRTVVAGDKRLNCRWKIDLSKVEKSLAQIEW